MTIVIRMAGTKEDRKTEKLINEIKKNPCLYDRQCPKYKHNEEKLEIWKEIARCTGMSSVKDAKRRWKSVRGQWRKNAMSSVVRPYKYNAFLEFLWPYLNETECPSKNKASHDEMDKANGDCEHNTRQDVSDDETAASSQHVPSASGHSQCVPSQSTANASSSRQVSPKKRKLNASVADETSEEEAVAENGHEVVKQCSAPAAEREDDIDHFMKSMAATIRKLPPHAIANVKYEIHGIVHQAEILYVFSNDSAFGAGSVYGFRAKSDA